MRLDHLEVRNLRILSAVNCRPGDGLNVIVGANGSGKTSLNETACLWALVYGHREFVALIGADGMAQTESDDDDGGDGDDAASDGTRQATPGAGPPASRLE